MFSAVLFDLDNTLIDRDAAARELWRTELPPSKVSTAMEFDSSDHGQLLRWLGWSAGHLSSKVADFTGADPRVIQMVTRVARTYPIAVASNGGPAQRSKLAAAGLSEAFRRMVFISSELNIEKPERAFFDYVTHAMGIDPSLALMVGDHPHNDILGAKHAGLKTCWISHGRRYPADQSLPDFQIEHITQLETLLC